MLRLQYYKETGQSDEAQHYEQFLRETGQWKDPAPRMDAATLKRRADARTRLNTNDQEQAQSETPDYLTQVLGGLAAFGKNIPGAEAAQAALRSASSRPDPQSVAAMAQHPLASGGADAPQSYRSALLDIQGAEGDAPAFVRGLNSITGGAITAAAMPGSPAASGALTGGLTGLLGADPDATAKDRLTSAAVQGTVGALAGKAADVFGTAARGLLAPSLGKATATRATATAAKDASAYGAAATEGAAAAPHPAVDAVLDSPDIKAFADMVRGARQFAGADQGTIVRETYKLMSKQQSGLAKRLQDQGFDAATKLAHDNIGLAKQELMTAADQIMPSFRGAVSGHAEMMSQKGAFDTAADATKRLLTGAHVTAKRLATQSPEAVTETLKQMREETAKSALEGTLGRLKEYNHASINPLKLFGAGPMVRNAAKVAPQVGLLDQIAGTGTTSKALRSAIVSGLLSTTH